MRFEGLREGPKSVGNEKPRRVIGAGSSETQPELALLPSALITTSNAALSSGAVAAYRRVAGLLGLFKSLRLLGSYF